MDKTPFNILSSHKRKCFRSGIEGVEVQANIKFLIFQNILEDLSHPHSYPCLRLC